MTESLQLLVIFLDFPLCPPQPQSEGIPLPVPPVWSPSPRVGIICVHVPLLSSSTHLRKETNIAPILCPRSCAYVKDTEIDESLTVPALKQFRV